MDRRSFLSDLTLTAGGLALAGSSLVHRAEAFVRSGDLTGFKAPGFGELVPTVSKNTGETFLSLPKGFEYNVLGRRGDIMKDGRPTPSMHDGMWTFKVKNELRVVRNHEVRAGNIPNENAGIGAGKHYDETSGGGTTTLVIDRKTNLIVKDFVSLSGTHTNCAGGPTPWGSWITCEETTLGAAERINSRGVKTGGFPKPHGYCFEVSAASNTSVDPTPLKAMGRFVHEAVAVDKKTSVVYETEDYNPGGFYRFVPKRKRKLAEGGVLQMLAVKNSPNYDTRTGQKQGAFLSAEWVTIDDPDPIAADTDPLAVYKQGKEKGGAIFDRLEGCVIDQKGRVYFTSTSGGDKKGGQIWMYEPSGRNEGRLVLIFESPDRSVLHMPDNICIRPKSQLIVICEDSDYAGQQSMNHLRILTPGGKIADLAKNSSKDFPRSEFAGATFSPDGSTLFVNMQAAGVTLAIWGDWSKFRA